VNHRAVPAVIDLAQWVGAADAGGDRPETARLEQRDAGLSAARTLLGRAQKVIEDLLCHAEPELSAPTAASELHLIADLLTDLTEPFEGAEQNPTLLSRAAVFCAGHEWAALGGVQASLRGRLVGVDEAIAQTAVRLARLRRCGPHLAIAPTPALLELEAEEQAVSEGLNQRAVLAGARSAFAAADAAFLPSLGDFLR
jgi:hypothetical protein